MKQTIKGITYDVKTAFPKCNFQHGNPVGSISETAYQTPTGHYFLVQRVSGAEDKIIPMSSDDMARWAIPSNKGSLFESKSRSVIPKT